jgi:hypothetical protein
MEKEIRDHIEKALVQYTKDGYYDHLIKAKDHYFKLTGQVNEEDEDFELRMNSFNDWYVFHFEDEGEHPPVIEKYITNNQLNENIKGFFENVNYSLFEYTGESFKKKHVFKDYIHKKKIYLEKGAYMPAFYKDDIFIGRFLSFEDNTVPLGGLCFLPKEIKSILKKQSKKVRKQNDPKKELSFLLNLEALKNRWAHYGHIEASKIFYFND